MGAAAYAQASGDIQYPMKWRFSQPVFNLNICVSAFVPVVNQAQVLENIKSCGEFVQPPARKRSSAAASTVQNFKKEAEQAASEESAGLSQFQYETCYHKVMLEQRMNQNIVFRKATDEFVRLNSSETLNDFDYDLHGQLNNLTRPSISEEERKKQQTTYQLMN